MAIGLIHRVWAILIATGLIHRVVAILNATDGKTILKSGQEWTLPAQLEKLKTFI